MSWTMTAQVAQHSRHKGSELLCLMMIANDTNDQHGYAFPSMEYLARQCRLSRRSTQRITQILQASGELTVEKNVGPGGTNRYTIHIFPDLFDMRKGNLRDVIGSVVEDDSDDADHTQPSESRLETGGDNLAPVTFMTQGDDIVVASGGDIPRHGGEDVTMSPRTVSQPKEEPKDNRNSESVEKELLEIEDVANKHPEWPTWYAVAYTVPGWTMTLEKAEAWRTMAKVSQDLAERVAYALRDWWPTSSDRRQKKGDPYMTWQNWCRRDRDAAPGTRAAQRQPVRTGSSFKGYGE